MELSACETEKTELCERRMFVCSMLAKQLIAVETAAEKARKSPRPRQNARITGRDSDCKLKILTTRE